MPSQETSIAHRLYEAGNPRYVNDWEGRDSYYVSACRVSVEDIPALIDVARKWTDWDWPGKEDLGDLAEEEDAELLPVTAWRTLGELEAEAAVEPLIDMLREYDEESGCDNWVAEEMPPVFGKIGPSAIEPLIRLAKDALAVDFVRSTAVRALRQIADYHPHTRDHVVASLTEFMTAAAANDADLNAGVMVELVELRATEAAEPIERAFAADRIDVGMMGDWDQVRKELGVEGLGLEMPENPYNSLDGLRERSGIGIFSDEPLFSFGDMDDDAVHAYYERASEAFSNSPEAQRVVDRFKNDVGWFRSLLDFGVSYRGESVDQMTLGSIKEYILDYVPRKVSTDADSAAEIVFELQMFWEFLDRVYQLPEAKAIVEWLGEEGLVDHLKKELSDPSNFGMAKSFFMSGKDSGYDMTTEEGLNQFMTVYNQRLAAAQEPAPEPSMPLMQPIVSAGKVGRNDPCPCGSGKKYKKCCR